MKRRDFYFIFLFFAFWACTKKVGRLPVISPAQPPVRANNNCEYQSSSVISFSASVLPIMINNCAQSCHSSPGAGGINLDSYSSIRDVFLSGQIMPVVINTDPSSIIMPPPPQRHLDSCQIKALNLWLEQGCQNN